MNKKQELVTKVLDQMERSCVKFAEGAQIRFEGSEWERYPEGHYNSDMYPTIEGYLACLNEDSLQRILELDIPEGVTFTNLWTLWGREGCFKCIPEVLHGDVPILRIRHDSYLSWFRGYSFQNSFDAHCNGSSGCSGNNLQYILQICEAPDTCEDEVVWEKKWALFRKAMLLSFPFSACGGRKSFYKVLKDYPEVFEDFFNQTDAKCMHANLDTGLTIADMKKMMRIGMSCPRVLDYGLVSAKGQFADILFGESAVSLVWSTPYSFEQYSISFPAWDVDSGLAKTYYLLNVWYKLTITLMTLSGISCTAYQLLPLDSADFLYTNPTRYPCEKQVHNLSDLWEKLSRYFEI